MSTTANQRRLTKTSVLSHRRGRTTFGIQAIRKIEAALGQGRLGLAHDASLQGFLLPACGKQGFELVLLLSHGLSQGSEGLDASASSGAMKC